MELLLGSGANINLCKENGDSPLDVACQNGFESIVYHLLTYGTDINLYKKVGPILYYEVCQNGHENTV